MGIYFSKDYMVSRPKFFNFLFANETPPFSSTPQTVISQNQSQSMQMLLDIQSKIDSELAKVKNGSQKESFLSNLKGKLSHMKFDVWAVEDKYGVNKMFNIALEHQRNAIIEDYDETSSPACKHHHLYF